MKITTKTGDDGTTSLFGGKRVGKNHPLIELVGSLDELQAFLVFAKVGLSGAKLATVKKKEIELILKKVIDDLYRMMGIVGFEMKVPKNIEAIGEVDVVFLEKYIEKYQGDVADLGKFIRPGSNELCARLNLARCVCRRVERLFVAGFEGAGEPVLSIKKYLNRLSDLIFILTQLKFPSYFLRDLWLQILKEGKPGKILWFGWPGPRIQRK